LYSEVVSVVAHYDDHFLWMGATIARMQAKGWNWTVVVMVDQGPVKRDVFERCCQ
jgi:LmbE family N-acetylglucosaminyl deacetylase